MSDKTKYYERLALQKRQFNEIAARDLARAKAHPLPRCQCGHTHHETQIFAVQEDRWKPPSYWCRACAPPDVRALCWPAGNEEAPEP